MFRPNLQSLLNHYQGFLFDIWGVIHDGHHPYPGVVSLINDLIAENKQVIFLSNAPRPGHVLIQKLIDYGINIHRDNILSSGDVLRDQLKHFNDPVFTNLGKRFYHLGAERNHDILDGLDVLVTENLEEAHFVLLTAYIDEEEDLNQHDAFLKKALDLNLPLICANPDKDVVNGHKIRYCAGFLAEKYEKMGGKVHHYGKPHPAIFVNAIQLLKDRGVGERNKILMIGDTLETDILGAKNAGIDSALVLAGNAERLLFKVQENAVQQNEKASLLEFESDDQKNYLQTLFRRFDLKPTWVLSALAT